MTTQKQKRGTSSQWSSASTALSDGEFGYDTTNKILKIGDGSTSWSSLPGITFNFGARIELISTTSAQTIATGGTTGDAVGTAANPWTGTSTNTSIITLTSNNVVTCKIAGRYSVSGSIVWTTNSTGNRGIWIEKVSGANTTYIYSQLTGAVASNTTRQSIAIPSINLSANDTLRLMAWQTSGAGLNLNPSSTVPNNFIVEYLGP